jgi:hypothetical protein
MCGVYAFESGQGTAEHSSEYENDPSGSIKEKIFLGHVRCSQGSSREVSYKMMIGLAGPLDGSNSRDIGQECCALLLRNISRLHYGLMRTICLNKTLTYATRVQTQDTSPMTDRSYTLVTDRTSLPPPPISHSLYILRANNAEQ